MSGEASKPCGLADRAPTRLPSRRHSRGGIDDIPNERGARSGWAEQHHLGAELSAHLDNAMAEDIESAYVVVLASFVSASD